MAIGRLDWWLLPRCQSRDPEGKQFACLYVDFPGTYRIVVDERLHIDHHM